MGEAAENWTQRQLEKISNAIKHRLRVCTFSNYVRSSQLWKADTQTLKSETACGSKVVHVAPLKQETQYKRGKCWQPAPSTRGGHEISNKFDTSEKQKWLLRFPYNENGTTKTQEHTATGLEIILANMITSEMAIKTEGNCVHTIYLQRRQPGP